MSLDSTTTRQYSRRRVVGPPSRYRIVDLCQLDERCTCFVTGNALSGNDAPKTDDALSSTV